VFTALTAADFLQFAYAAAQQAEQRLGQPEPASGSK
jgi:hypothetical protein